MPPQRLNDAAAKQVLREWPLRPNATFFPGGPWLRAQPPDGGTTGPRVIRPGSTDFSAYTQPDGLWLSFLRDNGTPAAVSVMAIEVCGTGQNLADKRSRYAPGHSAMLVAIEPDWLSALVQVQGGAQKHRWEATEAFDGVPPAALRLPVRSVRVLFALPNDPRPRPTDSHLFNRLKNGLALEAHEYLTRHSALAPTNSNMRSLVKRMLESHTI